MAQFSLPTSVFALLGCVLVAIVARAVKTRPVTGEPPYATETIPYFSHIYGLLRHGLRYFDLVR